MMTMNGSNWASNLSSWVSPSGRVLQLILHPDSRQQQNLPNLPRAALWHYIGPGAVVRERLAFGNQAGSPRGRTSVGRGP
jgi:hypothetical protein